MDIEGFKTHMKKIREHEILYREEGRRNVSVMKKSDLIDMTISALEYYVELLENRIEDWKHRDSDFTDIYKSEREEAQKLIEAWSKELEVK